MKTIDRAAGVILKHLSAALVIVGIVALSPNLGSAQQDPPPYPQSSPQPYPQSQYPPPQYPQQGQPQYPQQYPPQGQSQYPPQQYPQSGQPPYGQPGQPPYGQPPLLPPAELDRLVSRVALYPDPLLSQVLAAATYPNDIPEAARWAYEHRGLYGDPLSRAIADDRLPWDPSVQALLPFPSVLDMMARDMRWTGQIGDAFLSQQPEVMDAVQRVRRQAWDYGYLRNNGQIIVASNGPYIEIRPVNPGVIYVPAYDPGIIFVRPRPGFVAGAISFGPGITIGAGFAPWGWGAGRIVWSSHTVIINNRPWARTWVNRGVYVHPYAAPRYEPQRRIERHEGRERREERRDDRPR